MVRVKRQFDRQGNTVTCSEKLAIRQLCCTCESLRSL